jgi:molecular chaperone GrpE
MLVADDVETKGEAEATAPEAGSDEGGTVLAAEYEALKKDLSAAEAQAAEYLDGWQRARAEFANFRKRQEAERAQMMLLANAGLLGKLLPIADDFERAFRTLPECLDQLTWVDGLYMIRQKLEAVLQSEGVQPIDVEGVDFDPRLHEAITYEIADGFEEGKVIGDVQRGYMLGERVLRPALVRVAKGPAPVPEPEPDADAPAEDTGDG